MDRIRLGLLNGDGIGSEIVPCARRVIDGALARVTGLEVDWVWCPMGLEAIETHRSPLPDETKQRLGECAGWLMGPHDAEAYPEPWRDWRNPSGELRHHFELTENIRPSRNFTGLTSVSDVVDAIVVRENSEGFYADRNMAVGRGEVRVTNDVAISMAVFTRDKVERVAKTACDLASDRSKRLAIVHKANVLRLTMGLFRDVCLEVAEAYPELEVSDHHVDAIAASLISKPDQFDVIVAENMCGDILSNLIAELSCGLGCAPSLNAKGTEKAMGQASHGAAPDIAGLGIANPVGIMLSGALLLKWLGDKYRDQRLRRAGKLIEQSIETTFLDGYSTADLGGSSSTEEFLEKTLQAIATGDAGSEA